MQQRLPVVIAHRGASGYRPEHTLAAYSLAIALGADYVEPDLVTTGDGILVARHECEIGATTDVARHPDLARRRTTKVIDGRTVTGWFVEDLTLAELRTLRATERLPRLRPLNARYDGRYEVPTLDEMLALVRSASRQTGRAIGVYPELKNPSYSASIGLPMEPALAHALRRHHALLPGGPVFVQSFEPSCLRRLARLTSAPLVQLIAAGGAPYDMASAGDGRSFADLLTPSGLREISTYAAAIGVHKDLVLPRDPDGRLRAPTDLVGQAHGAGVAVHAWTFRNENRFLPADLRLGSRPGDMGDAAAEYEMVLSLGVDGVFTDFTDTAVAARDAYSGVGDRRLTVVGAARR